MYTIRILENCQTQQYMQESMSFQIWFLSMSGRSPIQNTLGPGSTERRAR